VDLSLAILIGATALFAGAAGYVAFRGELGRRRAALAAAGAAAGVAAGFLVMLLLATVALPATLAFLALAGGAVAYLVFLRDLGRRRAALAAAGAAAVVTASSLFVLYLAVAAFVGAIGVYLVVRTRLRIGPSVILMGTTLSGLLAASAAAFWYSLSYVM